MKKDVLIVGAGAVGQATGKGFARMGLNVVFYDVDRDTLEKLRNDGYNVSDVIVHSEYYVVCVPERFIEDVIRSIRNVSMSAKIIIKSTVPVGTTKKLSSVGHYPIFHNPEFLVEATAERDFLEPSMVVLGSPDGREDYKLQGIIRDLYWWVEPNRIVYTDSDVSEMVKLSLNGYLSTIIGYWNEVHRVCEKIGVNSHEVGRICSRDLRVTTYGSTNHANIISGKCLPKDLKALIELAESAGVEGTLFRNVQERNT